MEISAHMCFKSHTFLGHISFKIYVFRSACGALQLVDTIDGNSKNGSKFGRDINTYESIT
jgi:hypothetical protein